MEFKSGFWGRLFGFKQTERSKEQVQDQDSSLPVLVVENPEHSELSSSLPDLD